RTFTRYRIESSEGVDGNAPGNEDLIVLAIDLVPGAAAARGRLPRPVALLHPGRVQLLREPLIVCESGILRRVVGLSVVVTDLPIPFAADRIEDTVQAHAKRGRIDVVARNAVVNGRYRLAELGQQIVRSARGHGRATERLAVRAVLGRVAHQIHTERIVWIVGANAIAGAEHLIRAAGAGAPGGRDLPQGILGVVCGQCGEGDVLRELIMRTQV